MNRDDHLEIEFKDYTGEHQLLRVTPLGAAHLLKAIDDSLREWLAEHGEEDDA